MLKTKKHSEETRKKMSNTRKGKIPKNFFNFQKKGQESITNKPKSEEHKRKISIGNKGKIRSVEARKKYSIAKKGIIFSEQHRKNIGKIAKGRIPWNKGKYAIWRTENQILRNSPEYSIWRKAVYERDGYTCLWCGLKNGNGKTVILHADHIKPFVHYPELRFAIDNGRTLCIDCHKTTNTYGGNSRKKIMDN